MRDRYAIIEDFFTEAEAMRGAVDRHFSAPALHTPAEHQIWNYWYVPDTYTYLRTLPEKVFEYELARRFFDLLQQTAFERWGLAYTTWPFLSLYVSGCYQGLHNDAKGGRLGYVYSLTRWNRRVFSGGETLLFRDGNWNLNLTAAKATSSFYELVPQSFNQLLVFDDRVPHAVPRIEGTMAPCEGRIVLHGHFSETSITIEGAVNAADVNGILADAMAEAAGYAERAADDYHGLIVIRLELSDSDGAAHHSILFDRVMPLDPKLPPFPTADLIRPFDHRRFPRQWAPFRATIPITIGTGPT